MRKNPFNNEHKEKDDSSNVSNPPKDINKEIIDLISWNIQKVIDKDETLNLKTALIAAEDYLALNLRDGNTGIDKCSKDQQHLICALLAWRNLGNKNAESLHRFIETNNLVHQNRYDSFKLKVNRNNVETASSMTLYCNSDSLSSRVTDRGVVRLNSKGPVVKLPVNTKVVMRFEANTNRPTTKEFFESCCATSDCPGSLSKIDKCNEELRKRAADLARRETRRSEILNRAELAWVDLELGYQRRLLIAEEKNEELTAQIEKLLIERNDVKNECTELAAQLKEKGDEVVTQGNAFKECQKEVCDKACERLKLGEQVSKGEALLAEQQCKLVQANRDLQFKEEQAQRKLVLIGSETDSACALMHDTERALHAELSALRDQILNVSDQLLAEDVRGNKIKNQLDILREEKAAACEDLTECQDVCDSAMQKLVDQAKETRAKLQTVKDEVMQCRCQFPVHVGVEAKRTPSLVATCACPDDYTLSDKTCSCTSLRTNLISTLLGDLFGGLLSELPKAGVEMPCQLLKCLEDKHNWDRRSNVKTNVLNFFSQLLVGELDLAIARAIEKYHAKWIGATCADAHGPPERCHSKATQQRAVERKAKQLAEKLAEELFIKRAGELTKRAKEILTQGPPPCACGKQDEKEEEKVEQKSVLPCLVTYEPFQRRATKHIDNHQKKYWQQTNQNVAELKNQVHALKMAAVNKDDLKLLEEHIANVIKKNMETENQKSHIDRTQKNRKIAQKNMKADVIQKSTNIFKNGGTKNRNLETRDAINLKKNVQPNKPSKPPKKYFSRNFAVNVCLCGDGKSKNKMLSGELHKINFKANEMSENVCPLHGVKSRAPIKLSRQDFARLEQTDDNNRVDCPENCHCLRREPSNKSLDVLLDHLSKWNSKLNDADRKFLNQSKCNLNSKCPLRDFCKNTLPIASTMLCSSKILNKNVSAGNSKMRTELSAKRSKPKDIHNDVVNTASIYMAEVNLDKSNEFINKDVNTTEREKIINNLMNENQGSKIISDSKGKGNENKNLCTTNSTSSNLNVFKFQSFKTATSNNLSYVSDLKTQSNNFDYIVDFLGVTISDVVKDKLTSIPDQKEKWLQKNDSSHIQKQVQGDIEKSNVIKKTNPAENFEISNKTEEDKLSNLKLEELRTFIVNIFNDQFNKKAMPHKDVGLDSYSFDATNDYVYGNSYKISSKNLEGKTFGLLEDHLKEKIKLIKKHTSVASCITPEAEKQIFSSILQKVKQVISDIANENQSKGSGVLNDDGSWRRVYGLMQEYLKFKLKHIKGLPIQDEKVFPIILDKINNLIEHDFQRLKDICNSTQTIKTNKNILPQEMPEKDSNTFNLNCNDNNLRITRNRDHKEIKPFLTPQVECCDAVVATNEITVIPRANSPIILNDNISVQVQSKINRNIMCSNIGMGRSSVFNQLNTNCTEFKRPYYARKYDNSEKNILNNSREKKAEEKYHRCYISKSVPGLGISKKCNDVYKRINKHGEPLPLFGCTVKDCERTKQYIPHHPISKVHLGSIKTEKTKLCNIKFNRSTNENLLKHAHQSIQFHNDISRATSTNSESIDDLILAVPDRHSKNKDSVYQQFINTCDDSSHRTDAENLFCQSCFQYRSKGKSTRPIFANSDYRYISDSDRTKLCKSEETIHNQKCRCNKVPVCHVKMLLNNIENDIMMSRCTCDMMSIVCPVHV